MPKHVACIRKQVLASRRLEELDLPLGNIRRSRPQSSTPASGFDEMDSYPKPLPRLGGGRSPERRHVNGSRPTDTWQGRQGQSQEPKVSGDQSTLVSPAPWVSLPEVPTQVPPEAEHWPYSSRWEPVTAEGRQASSLPPPPMSVSMPTAPVSAPTSRRGRSRPCSPMRSEYQWLEVGCEDAPASLKCLAQALSNLAWGSIDTEAGEWTLESPDPSLEPPHSSLITYADYVARTYPADRTMEEQAREENLRLAAEKRERFTMPGEPGSKFRSMFDQMIKNLQHSNKALAKAFDIKKVFLKEEELPEDAAKSEAQNIMRFGRHQILPSFWNLLIQLTKQQRRFSVVLRSFNEEQLIQAQKELQLFVQCQHPAYNGQNKTHKPPLMDGNKAGNV
eukprot:g25753.t1